MTTFADMIQTRDEKLRSAPKIQAEIDAHSHPVRTWKDMSEAERDAIRAATKPPTTRKLDILITAPLEAYGPEDPIDPPTDQPKPEFEHKIILPVREEYMSNVKLGPEDKNNTSKYSQLGRLTYKQRTLGSEIERIRGRLGALESQVSSLPKEIECLVAEIEKLEQDDKDD